MKITDPDVIKSGEKDLIDAVKEDLDLDTVKKILEKRMAASSLSPDGGEIIVHNNEIAFRLNFNIQLSGSLMFDRQGNYIPDPDEALDEKDSLSSDFDLNDIEKPLEDEELNIDLPDYSLDDDQDDDLLEQEALTEDQESPELPEDDLNILNESDSSDEKPVDDIGEDDLLDDDISDILKESRDFWEQKKDS